MFDFIRDHSVATGLEKYSLLKNNKRLTYSEVIELWQVDSEFRQFFINLLRDSTFRAFRWETPPVSIKNPDQLFEFVLVDSLWLIRAADQKPFEKYFRNKNLPGGIVDFRNLGGDARLIVPVPVHRTTDYSHLAAFIRTAKEEQIHALWIRTGKSMADSLSTKPIWLSTAGGGVDWLHIRLDSRPKYYHYDLYKSAI